MGRHVAVVHLGRDHDSGREQGQGKRDRSEERQRATRHGDSKGCHDGYDWLSDPIVTDFVAP